jgi:hypothetical protein
LAVTGTLGGWCAVVLPDEDEFQGYILPPETPMTLESAERLAQEGVDLGGVMAVLVHGAATRNPGVVMAAAARIRQMNDTRFFWIAATRLPAGVVTTFRAIEAVTEEEARAVFLASPEVVEITRRIAAKAPRVKH